MKVNPTSQFYEIDSKPKSLRELASEVWSARDLLRVLIRREFVAHYKQSLIGPFWSLFQPIFSSLVFVVFFHHLAKVATGGLPPLLFYLSGLMVWGLFASTLQRSSDFLVNNASIFGKVYFPRLIVPIASWGLALWTFIVQLLVLIGFSAFYHFQSGVEVQFARGILLSPLLGLVVLSFSLGTGLIIASSSIRFRDLLFSLSFVIQMWMFASPVVYSSAELPAKYAQFYFLNPMASVIEINRWAWFGGSTEFMENAMLGLLLTFLVLLLGLWKFSRIERNFIDTI